MSKDIVIKSGGVGRKFTTDKLKTGLVGGGACLWVPEDETQLITKEITANGVYRPADDGVYGFSEIVVNVPTGGDDHGDDPVEEKTLTGITITTPPIKTEYDEGDPLDYTGLEVTAEYSDGSTEDVTTACVVDPVAGSAAVVGSETVTVTYATGDGSEPMTASFGITVKKKAKPTVKAIELLGTTYEESLARIKEVMSIPAKMLQRIEAKRTSVFGGASLNIVLSAGYCNYKGSGSTRFTLSDITPYVGTGKYLYQFGDPAPGVSQGTAIFSEYASYREFYPHQYMWDNCSGNAMFFVVGTEGEIQKDSAYTTPWLSDLCLGFGSDVFDYNPFSSDGSQPYQALAANFRIVDVEDPNA